MHLSVNINRSEFIVYLVGCLILSLVLGSVPLTADDIETESDAVSIYLEEGRLQTQDISEEPARLEMSIIHFSAAPLQSGVAQFGAAFEETELTPKPIILDAKAVPDGEGVCNSLNKTYMPYTAVTSKRSAQYALLNSDKAYSDPVTGLRMYEGRYCIAVGSFYSQKIGTKLNLIMENGSVVECITGDAKADVHTDPTHRYQAVDGSVVEMIVDYKYFSSTKQYPDCLRGRVLQIVRVE